MYIIDKFSDVFLSSLQTVGFSNHFNKISPNFVEKYPRFHKNQVEKKVSINKQVCTYINPLKFKSTLVLS